MLQLLDSIFVARDSSSASGKQFYGPDRIMPAQIKEKPIGCQHERETGRRHQAVRPLQSAAALRNGVLDDGCKLRPQSILPSIFVPQTRHLQGSWQLDGLYSPSLILPLDLGTLYAAPSWCKLFASWPHLGRNKCLLRKILK